MSAATNGGGGNNGGGGRNGGGGNRKNAVEEIEIIKNMINDNISTSLDHNHNKVTNILNATLSIMLYS